ncbi:MAG: helix-turn-helix domain-containing protein [Catenulispora sp.]|nr:helix-turn-helix domain-containing protein [Catenulispora sp.]
MIETAAGTAAGHRGAGRLDRDIPERHGARRPTGRDGELGHILGRIGPDTADSRILVLLGAEGIGKTWLLRAVCEQAAAAGVHVLSAQSWTVEKEVAFAGLRRLVAAASAGSVDQAADFHGHADVESLDAAALLNRLAAPGRTLIAVDDVQDCDPATVAALCQMVRHATTHPVSVLLAGRGDAGPCGLPPEAEILRVGPLGPRSAAALLDAQPGAPTGRRRLELLRDARGNPSALLELCRDRGMPDDSAFPAGPDLLGTRIEREFEMRIRGLPPETQRALLYATTALPGESLATITGALGADDLDVWAPAETAGLIAIRDGQVVFRHPLGRSAAGRQPVHVRHRAHSDLAAAVGAARPAVRAQHVAATSLGADEATARMLNSTAWTAGDTFTAARILERAAELSDAPGQVVRLADALVAACALGDLDWVRTLHEDLVRRAADPVLGSAAACAVASTLSLASYQQEAFDLLLEAADRCPDPDGPLALAVAAVAAGIAEASGLPEHYRRLPGLQARADAAIAARTQSESVSETETEGAAAWLNDGDVRSALNAYVSTVTRDDAAAGLTHRLEQPRLGTLSDDPGRLVRRLAVAAVAYRADDPEPCLAQFRKADAELRARAAFGVRAWLLAPLVDTLLATGRWTEAEALTESAMDQAVVLKMSRVATDLHALTLTLSALRGDTSLEDPAPRYDGRLDGGFQGAAHGAFHSALSNGGIDLAENGAARARLARAHGLTAMARGDWAAGFRRLRSLFSLDGEPVHPHLSPRAIADLAVAAARSGRSPEAAKILERTREQQGDRPSIRMTLLMHHAAALVDPDTDPEDAFQLALVNPAGEQWPLERAQARFSYALWLRRARRTSEAREQLTSALEAAEELGADGLATAIRGEMRASGVATAPEPAAALAALTAQQRQIVHLAARGLSNREIGDQLYLSPRTVGSHLYNVYPKLGISSRHQLRDVLERG